MTRLYRFEIAQQFDDIGGKLIGVGVIAAQGPCRRLVRARGASQAEVDASSVPNCSATCNGAWLGSMIPPAPTRIVDVPLATWPMSTAVAALAMPGML